MSDAAGDNIAEEDQPIEEGQGEGEGDDTMMYLGLGAGIFLFLASGLFVLFMLLGDSKSDTPAGPSLILFPRRPIRVNLEHRYIIPELVPRELSSPELPFAPPKKEFF